MGEHAGGGDAAPHVQPPGRRQEAQEEAVHEAEEDPAQAQEGEACGPQILQSRWPGQGPAACKECPQASCGPGCFMATHFNRYHCGKCSLTYVSKSDDA